MELVKLGEIEPYTVVVANNQTNGKGQNGNKWHSKDGLNLTFSLYVPHNMLKVENQFALNKAIAIGLTTAITSASFALAKLVNLSTSSIVPKKLGCIITRAQNS